MGLLGKLVVAFVTLGVGQSLCPHESADLKNWGESSTWPSNELPAEDDNVTISSGMMVRLDQSPPCLSSITIEAGASLVWGDVDDITLCVSYILIKGLFQIGSEDCRFTKKANIQLIGESNSPLFVNGFGRKFIGVAAGGTIEIHGEEKPSWTKLIQTAPAATDTCGNIFNFQTSPFSSETGRGLYVAVFNLDGSLYDFGIFRTGEDMSGEDVKFQEFLASIPAEKILAVALQGDIGIGDWSKVYSALETVGGLTSSVVREVSGREAYAFITKTGHSSTTVEKHVANPNGDDYVETGYLVLNDNNLQFRVNSKVHKKSSNTKGVKFQVLSADVAFPCIKVNADVSKWRAGDKVVIASTDFDWKQAEEMTIKSSYINELCFTEPLKYMHYGEVTLGVDERAEVGLLSRNILIEGIVQKEGCTWHDEEDKVLCDRFGFDTFGGQIKVIKGFAAAHIQGVELFHMGQDKHVGTYPLHFHMCDDVDGNWFRHNSIHHTMRCVTVHGTDGAEVSNNVCYFHRGHGMFLEDSAEQRNIFDSNLVIGTMHGSHLMSDMDKDWCSNELRSGCDAVSSYWITHPNNYFINNVAAGGENVGFWIMAASQPLGPSFERQKERGLVKKNFAMETKILEFRNNTAHSYKDRGMRIDGRISHGEKRNGVMFPENAVILPGVSHTPKVVPGDKKSAFDKSHLHSLTAYKNKAQNVWTKAGIVIMNNFTLADATKGIIMASAKGGTYAQISGSLFVGETDNTGVPQGVFGRSRPKQDDEPLQGVLFYQGPGVVTNSFFNKYQTKTAGSITRYAGAISVKRSNPYPPRANSHVEGIKFGFCDVTEGNWAFNGAPNKPHFRNRDGNRQITFRDVDGGVSGTAETQFVPNTRFHTTPRCDYRENMNFAVCPYDYAKVIFSGDGALKDLDMNYPMFLRRDDRPDDAFALKGTKGNNYLVIKEKSYTVYFNGTAPHELRVTARNMERGDSLRLGICYPKDVTSFTFFGGFGNINNKNPAIKVNTIDDLDSDTTGRAYFHDSTRGLLFVKLYSTNDRVDHEQCPNFNCPPLRIKRNDGSNNTVDCYDDAYDGTYNKPEDAAIDIPSASGSCDKTTSDGFGAEVEENFFPTSQSLTCPPVPENPDLIEVGCFKDVFIRDLPHSMMRLPMSMTADFCVQRCYNRGYVYAAVQNGNECRCGHLYGGYGVSSDCNKKCTGNENQICGGVMANNVYATGNQELPALTACDTRQSGAIIDGKCYFLTFSNFTYVSAQRQCMKLGGNLATISSESVQFDVERYMRTKMVNAWIGLNDIMEDGTFTYTDGTSNTYQNFIPGQGDSTMPSGVALISGRMYHWDDRAIGEKIQALCRLESDGPPAPVNCGYNNNGQMLNGGNCYAVVSKGMRYSAADLACYQIGGTVADASDSLALAEIQKHVYLFGVNMHYWVAKEGDNIIKLHRDLLYNKAPGTNRQNSGVVCKIEQQPTLSDCGPDSKGKIIDGKCYYLTPGSYSYLESQRQCKKLGGNLATINSEYVQFNVQWYLMPSMVNAWFGLNDIETEGSYQFIDGTAAGGYSNFVSGEGTNANHDGVALMANKLHQWDDRVRGESNQALCQLDATGPPTPVSCGHNNYGQQIEGGECYAVLSDTTLSYRDAQYACYTRRGVLADASDSAKLADIKNHIYIYGKNIDYWVEKEDGNYTELEYTKLYTKETTRNGNRNGIVCKIETMTVDKPCSTGWIKHGDFCYLYTATAARFNQYQGLCNQGDSQVLTIENESENIFVGNTVKTQTTKPFVMLGFVYNATSETYVWDNGSSSSYTNWDKNHGDNNTAAGECAIMKSANYKWINRKCRKGAFVVCKAPAGP